MNVSSLVLRDYQQAAITDLARLCRQRPLLVAPTGSGKTVIFCRIIAGAVAKGNRVLLIVHRKELLDQASDKLDYLGVDHGVIMGDHWRDRPHLPVQIGSIQTLIRRDPLVPAPNIIILDEAHHAVSSSWAEVLSWYPDAVVIGVTATPVRMDGRGLGSLFQSMVLAPTVRELTEQGYLVPIRCWKQPKPDLQGIHKTAGDYNQDELAVRMNQSKLVGSLVSEYQRHAAGRRTLVFAVNIAHSRAIQQEFVAAGIACEHLDGETPKSLREAVLQRLRDGRTRVVTNCQVLTEGFDCPEVSCVSLARPTLSLGLYLQMAGRALRPAEGKVDCILLDHAGCVDSFGLPDDDQDWELTEGKVRAAKKSISLADEYKVCPECGQLARKTALSCSCGYEYSQRKAVQTVEGELIAVTEEIRKKIVPLSRQRRDYERGLWLAAYGKKKDGSPFSSRYPESRFAGMHGYHPPAAWRAEWIKRQGPQFAPKWV